MKLSISNIAWRKEVKEIVYDFLKKEGIFDIEIAPSLIVDNPYDNVLEAKKIIDDSGFVVCSMQSILFNRTEMIFNSDEEMESTLNYLYKGIDFAMRIGCKNLVFGSPKNRNVNNEVEFNRSVEFFKALDNYLENKDVVLALEANPKIYDTNFLNTTFEVFDYVRSNHFKNIKVNLDLGTIIENNEDLTIIKNNIDLISHVHISEPYLNLIEKREIHKELISLLKEYKYNGFVSIEMKTQDNLDDIFNTVKYVKGIIDEK